MYRLWACLAMPLVWSCHWHCNFGSQRTYPNPCFQSVVICGQSTPRHAICAFIICRLRVCIPAIILIVQYAPHSKRHSLTPSPGLRFLPVVGGRPPLHMSVTPIQICGLQCLRASSFLCVPRQALIVRAFHFNMYRIGFAPA